MTLPAAYLNSVCSMVLVKRRQNLTPQKSLPVRQVEGLNLQRIRSGCSGLALMPGIRSIQLNYGANEEGEIRNFIPGLD